jgi:hypothetical protein
LDTSRQTKKLSRFRPMINWHCFYLKLFYCLSDR